MTLRAMTTFLRLFQSANAREKAWAQTQIDDGPDTVLLLDAGDDAGPDCAQAATNRQARDEPPPHAA